MRRALRVPLVALAASWLALAACARRGAQDVVVITLDTVRTDRLGCYGHRGGLTPAIDALAARGVLFEDASCAVPLTLPSHASLFTGRYPTATGVRNNGTFVLPGGETTLAERLSSRGWRTGAVIAAFPLKSRYGLAQGFDVYDEELPGRTEGDGRAFSVHFNERDARTVTDRALSVWARLAGGPRFLWVHYFDAHAPYAAPDPWGASHAENPYDGEVAYVDAEVGRLLAGIERESPDAVIVVAADHGEGLGEHGEKTHGVFLYQSTVHVPLLIAVPGRWPAGRRIAQAVSLADVVPTLLTLLGAAVPPEIDGTDLAPLLSGSATARREVYGESYLPLLEYRFSPLKMLRDGPLKYIDAPTVELYDVASDPAETRNLAGERRDGAKLASRLAAVVSRSDPAAAGRAVGSLDAESAARLRSLGYASSGPSGGAPVGRGRDPKTMTGYLQRYDRAVGLAASGRIDEGLAALRELRPEAPENSMLGYQIAGALLAAGRAEEARIELEQVVAATPEFGSAHFMLGDCLVALGRLDDATRSFEAAALQMPTEAGPKLAEGRALEARGRFEAAAEAYRAAVASEPSSSQAARALVALRAGRGDPARAIDELGELAARFPEAAALQTALADAQYRQGDTGSAATSLHRALALDPARTEARLLEAEMLLDSGRPNEAAAAYRAVLQARPHLRAAELGLRRALVSGGVLLERRGDTAGALAAYREALALDPRDADATAGVERISRGP